MGNIKVFDKKQKRWWIPVAGDEHGRVEVGGHIWNPITQQWDVQEKADEDTPRRLAEELLVEAIELNVTTLELLDVTRRYAKEKTFKREDHIFFNAYNPVNESTYVFDQIAQTGLTSGWLDTNEYDVVRFSVMVTTLASATILLLIQGPVAGQLTDIYTETFTAVTTRAEEVVVTHPPSKMRVGLMVTTNGTDSVTITCERIKL